MMPGILESTSVHLRAQTYWMMPGILESTSVRLRAQTYWMMPGILKLKRGMSARNMPPSASCIS